MARDVNLILTRPKMQTTTSTDEIVNMSRKTLETDDDRITVKLDKRSYDILICQHRLRHFGKLLRDRGVSGDVMVFTSPTIGDLHFKALEESLRSGGFDRIVRHDIPDGEKNKNFRQYNACLEALTEEFPESGEVPTVINLGGGVVGDLGGFAAATFRRGVPYIQVPTTLLGDVDCGVGGKVAINFGDAKNLVGTFYQPKLVFTELSFLKTLDKRQIRSGVAEVIKYGTVCSRSLFEYLEKNIEKLIAIDPPVLRHVVQTCYKLKAEVVEQDEEDNKGVRIVLNFGHTVGHALEMQARYELTHGEAISVGMLAAVQIAIKLNACGEEVYTRLRSLIQRAGLPVSIPAKLKIRVEDLIATMKRDKKAVGGMNRFVSPQGIGGFCKRDGVKEHIIAEVLKSLSAA